MDREATTQLTRVAVVIRGLVFSHKPQEVLLHLGRERPSAEATVVGVLLDRLCGRDFERAPLCEWTVSRSSTAVADSRAVPVCRRTPWSRCLSAHFLTKPGERPTRRPITRSEQSPATIPVGQITTQPSRKSWKVVGLPCRAKPWRLRRITSATSSMAKSTPERPCA